MLIVILLLAYPLSRLRRDLPLKYWPWSLLIIGLVPTSIIGVLIVVAWFIMLNLRKSFVDKLNKWQFNLLQLFLVALTMISAGVLVSAVTAGLLGSPDMHVVGNNSSAQYLAWYQDVVDTVLPQATVISVPLYVYRLFMLLWALWMAFSLMKWAQWAWFAFSHGGYWRSIEFAQPVKKMKKDNQD